MLFAVPIDRRSGPTIDLFVVINVEIEYYGTHYVVIFSWTFAINFHHVRFCLYQTLIFAAKAQNTFIVNVTIGALSKSITSILTKL